MKNRKVTVATISLIVIGVLAGSVFLLGSKRAGAHRYVPTRNTNSNGGKSLYLYVRQEDSFPGLFRMLQRLQLYRPSGLIEPTAHWQVLNMDATKFRDIVRQSHIDTVEIETLDDVSCLVVDSRIDPKWFRSTPVPTEETTLSFNVQERYPQYFATAISAVRK